MAISESAGFGMGQDTNISTSRGIGVLIEDRKGAKTSWSQLLKAVNSSYYRYAQTSLE